MRKAGIFPLSVRISDMIAYIGKDRQDAIKTKLIDSESVFAESEMANTMRLL